MRHRKLAESRLGRSRVGRVNKRDEDASRRHCQLNSAESTFLAPLSWEGAALQACQGLPRTEPLERTRLSKPENSLLAGNLQGISFVGAFECDYWLGI